MTCIAEVEFHVKQSPDFERVFREETVWGTACEAVHALLDFEEEEEIGEIVREALIRSGVAAAEARSTANEILRKHPEELRQAVRDALVCEAEEALIPTPEDLDEALEYRRNRYAASTWEAALEACNPPPVDVLAEHLRPKNLACPLGPVELEELVDCHWVEELVNEAEDAVHLEWHVEPDLTVRVKLKAGPALVELLSLAVQARGGFGLRSDMSLEEVLAAAAFAGIGVERMLEPFRWWLHDFAGSLQRRLVEALVNVVNRRWEWWYPKGKHVVEFLREYGLLKPAETLERWLAECGAKPVQGWQMGVKIVEAAGLSRCGYGPSCIRARAACLPVLGVRTATQVGQQPRQAVGMPDTGCQGTRVECA